MRILTVVLFALVALFAASPAGAADHFVPDSAARLQIVSRDGEKLVVDITNPTDAVARFDTIGLYFIPDDGSEQRLGVVSAGQIAEGGKSTVAPEILSIAPNATMRLTLQAYCIDEHRSSPGAATHYELASKRMPAPLATALAVAAHDRSAQYAIWRVRREMPVALIGDQAHPL